MYRMRNDCVLDFYFNEFTHNDLMQILLAFIRHPKEASE